MGLASRGEAGQNRQTSQPFPRAAEGAHCKMPFQCHPEHRSFPKAIPSDLDRGLVPEKGAASIDVQLAMDAGNRFDPQLPPFRTADPSPYHRDV